MLQLRIAIVLEYWYQRNCQLTALKGQGIMLRSRMFTDSVPFEKTMMYYAHIIGGRAL